MNSLLFIHVNLSKSHFFISAVCRHFAKGNCWQGNMCAFLHVHQDPDSVSEDTESIHEQSLVTTTETSSNDNVIK